MNTKSLEQSVIISIYTFVLVFLSLPAAASDGTNTTSIQRLTLNAAFKKALENNPMMLQAKASVKKADANVGQAISAFLPKVNVDFAYSHTDNPVMVFSHKLNQADFSPSDFEVSRLNNPDFRDNWRYRLVMMQPIFNQGREYIGYKTSKLAQSIADLGYLQVAQTVLFTVEKAYCQALLAKDKVEVLQLALKTAQEHEKLARKRYDAGLVLKSDLLGAIVHRTKVERQLFKAESDFRIALAALDSAMGIDQATSWILSPLDFEEKKEDQINYWIETAKKHRPEFFMAKRQEEIAEYQYRQSLFRFLPSLNIMGVYEGDRQNLAYFGGDSWSLMATVSLNVFNGFGDIASISAADAEKKRAGARLKQVEQQIELQVRQAFFRFQTAKKQLKVAKEAVKQAKEGQKILKNRYSNGLALMVELLAADTTVKETSLEEAAARYDARLAWSELRRMAGILGKEVLK